jgi:hypothetical protein
MSAFDPKRTFKPTLRYETLSGVTPIAILAQAPDQRASERFNILFRV